LLIKSKNTETYLSTVFLAAQINIFLIIDVHSSILHFSFFILHLKLGEPLRAPSVRSRRAIRSITFAGCARYGGSATIPLAKRGLCPRVSARFAPSMLVSKRIKNNVFEPQRGGIFIANIIAFKMSPSGAAHITLGVAPLGLLALAGAKKRKISF
jgi:hypothetical protein